MKYTHPIEPGRKVKLREIDPGSTGGLNKEKGAAEFAKLAGRLEELQEQLFAAREHALFVVLQGMDTSGKDGAIRKVLSHVSPQGCRVETFKVPTEEELAHDFLWRVHKVTPRRGMVAVFNRSHYEDVVVVRVHGLVAKEVWKARYSQINHFEEMLARNRTLIVKLFLHISNEEQEERLLAREQDPVKAWKLNAGDWKERELWDEYQEAYEDALSRCSTEAAPWHVIPANHKWFRDVAVAEALVAAMEPHGEEWRKTLERMSAEGREELEALRAGRQSAQPG
jgi:PPK2 family polyphosphate:nucleotide phosphotransferase